MAKVKKKIKTIKIDAAFRKRAERHVRSLIQWEQQFQKLAAYMAANPSERKA